MQFKKSKIFLAAILSAAMTCSAMLPTVASAAGDRTKDEAYGDETYAARFMSLYQDVVVDGVENGYMSSTSTVDGGLGIPYHSVETLVIEAPDYGHETTSEALSYLVWVAAMHDNIVNDAQNGEVTVANTSDDYGTMDASTEDVGDLSKAWLTLESTMIPDTQTNFMSKGSELSATYSDEWEQVEYYPTDMESGKTAKNPIHQYFCNAYSIDGGLYLMHWLADVDDWYGYGSANGYSYSQENVDGTFTLINTFQRGEQESCWETIPHACIDLHNKGYGITSNGEGGMKGFFNTESNPAQQYSYTNAPDAEDRAIQAVYDAERWGVSDQTVDSKWGGTQSITALAAKMGDETRNNMYDKYYQAIGVGTTTTVGTSASWNGGYGDVSVGKHYLMNWYTSWGGALDGSWAWQIGASHMHEFYQNPLAAYALAYDDTLSSEMDAQGAVSDFQTSLERQIEFYLWLLSSNGPIAGGATNSYAGRYEGYPDGTSTFYNMAYVEHPVYADPGSNHWIGNQVWAVQRLAELYYQVTQIDTENASITIGQTGMTLQESLETILDKWVGWFLDNTILGTASETYEYTDYYEPYDTEKTTWELPDLSTVTDDGVSYSIPSSLIWDGQPETWTGTYQENTDLTCTIVGYGSSDLGCISSLANTLIYYAKARGVSGDDLDAAETSYKETKANGDSYTTLSTTEEAQQALYLAQQLLDREWESYRDDIGLSQSDVNSNLVRLWETELVLPNGTRANGDGQVLSASRYVGYMPNGDYIADGVAFVDIRSNYENDEMYQAALADYEETGTTDNYSFKIHRFWHAGDIMMALGTMYELYPDVTPTTVEAEDTFEVTVDPTSIGVGETATLTATLNNETVDGITYTISDTSVATIDGSTVTGVGEGTATVTATYTDADGNTLTATVDIEVTASDEELEMEISPSEITVGDTATVTVTKGGETVDVTLTVDNESIATIDGTTITGESEGTVTITATDADGNTVIGTVTVTASTTTTTDVTTTTESTTGDEGSSLFGDVNLDGEVTLADSILLMKYIAGSVDLNAQALLNADCNSDNGVQETDAVSLMKFLVCLLDSLPE